MPRRRERAGRFRMRPRNERAIPKLPAAGRPAARRHRTGAKPAQSPRAASAWCHERTAAVKTPMYTPGILHAALPERHRAFRDGTAKRTPHPEPTSADGPAARRHRTAAKPAQSPRAASAWCHERIAAVKTPRCTPGIRRASPSRARGSFPDETHERTRHPETPSRGQAGRAAAPNGRQTASIAVGSLDSTRGAAGASRSRP